LSLLLKLPTPLRIRDDITINSCQNYFSLLRTMEVRGMSGKRKKETTRRKEGEA